MRSIREVAAKIVRALRCSLRVDDDFRAGSLLRVERILAKDRAEREAARAAAMSPSEQTAVIRPFPRIIQVTHIQGRVEPVMLPDPVAVRSASAL